MYRITLPLGVTPSEFRPTQNSFIKLGCSVTVLQRCAQLIGPAQFIYIQLYSPSIVYLARHHSGVACKCVILKNGRISSATSRSRAAAGRRARRWHRCRNEIAKLQRSASLTLSSQRASSPTASISSASATTSSGSSRDTGLSPRTMLLTLSPYTAIQCVLNLNQRPI